MRIFNLLIFNLLILHCSARINFQQKKFYPELVERKDPFILSEPERNKEKLPKIVIIIDDIGLRPSQIEKFLILDIPITFAILPFSKYGRSFAEILNKLNKEIILHLPLEPEEKKQMTLKGFLLTDMTEEETIEKLLEAMEDIPYIRGVSTHMGSKYTKKERNMKLILKKIKEIGLFFIDSRTDSETIGDKIADEIKIPHLHRDVFIDNERDVEKILKHLKIVEDLAYKKGFCVAIGHPYDETAKALSIWLRRIKPFYNFVFASDCLSP